MADTLEKAYHTASGYCLDAMQSLRHLSGAEAIESLKSAIRVIEDGKRRADRERLLEMSRAPRAPIFPPPINLDF